MQKNQIRRGVRPPRDKRRADGVTLVQANVTVGSSLAEEMRFGEAFEECDFAAIQELALVGDNKESATRRLLDAGWDCIVDEPYFKQASHGGRTAIFAARWSGVRPLGILAGEAAQAIERLQGRLSACVIALVGGILLLSFYALDGQTPNKQIPLLRDLGRVIRLIGLPFIILGDWQILPSELEATGWPRIMGAQVVAPAAPTNLHTKRCIDYAVMSLSLASLVDEVDVVSGARFSPHAPVRIRMRCPRSLGNVVRLSQPRLYSAERPEPTLASGETVIDWSDWIRVANDLAESDPDAIDASDIDAMLQQWYASADMELRDMFGHAGKPDEATYMGIGRPPAEVEGAAGARRRGAPDESGILGHRLAWTANALHLATMWFRRCRREEAGRPDVHPHTLRRDIDAQRGIVPLFRSMVHRAKAFRSELARFTKKEEDAADWLTLEAALVVLEHAGINYGGYNSRID